MVSEQAENKAEKLARLDQGFAAGVPHNKALGLKFVEFEGATAWFKLPYDERLVGNPHTGILHGGAITSMLDAACALPCFSNFKHSVRSRRWTSGSTT